MTMAMNGKTTSITGAAAGIGCPLKSKEIV
jgi:short-subunit dehydrogenase involved in D-alanine esterification of teichoic acids